MISNSLFKINLTGSEFRIKRTEKNIASVRGIPYIMWDIL